MPNTCNPPRSTILVPFMMGAATSNFATRQQGREGERQPCEFSRSIQEMQRKRVPPVRQVTEISKRRAEGREEVEEPPPHTVPPGFLLL